MLSIPVGEVFTMVYRCPLCKEDVQITVSHLVRHEVEGVVPEFNPEIATVEQNENINWSLVSKLFVTAHGVKLHHCRKNPAIPQSPQN